MTTRKRRPRVILQLEELEPRLAPAASASLQNFDTTPIGTLPSGWSQWSSIAGTDAVAVSSSLALSAPNSLAIASPMLSISARAWINGPAPADVQDAQDVRVGADVYLDSPIPAEILARGSDLDGNSPSYYAVTVTQGLNLQLIRVDDGTTTTLGQVSSTNWIDNQWVNVTLYVNGDSVRAQVQRDDTGQYLNAYGQWQSQQTWALNVTDSNANLNGGSEIGVGNLLYSPGVINFDNFTYSPVTVSSQLPSVSLIDSIAGTSVSGVTQVQANATDSTGITRVEFYVDNQLRGVDLSGAPYTWSFDTTEVANGPHTLTVMAYDANQNIGQVSETFTTQNDLAPLPQPNIPLHNANIGLADLAYNGGSPQLDPSDIPLLQNNVDLVVSDLSYLSQIHAVAPNTPQLIYTNLSDISDNLLTAWDAYADAHGDSREDAFYHVTQTTPYSGAGGSSRPVDWFWAVYVGSSTPTDRTTLSDWTWRAPGGNGPNIAFGGAGQSVYIGYPEMFWEINYNLISTAGNGWSSVLEYPTAVDADGTPTAWATLPTLGDTSNGLTQSGQVTFNPPADWKTASINGSAPLYFVRVRTVTPGTAPVANTILGDDYTNSHGTTTGEIPAFDWALAPQGGYLDPQQYAIASEAGYTARFAYQSRLFHYGPMRFATNPGDAAFRAFAVSYEVGFLNANPLAAGLFVDNSNGIAPVTPGGVIEPSAAYSTDYASMLYQIDRAIAPHWIIANTGGGGVNANATVQSVQGYFEEFALRPMATNYLQFEQMAGRVATRLALASPSPYAILDTNPQGGAATDPRTEIGALAYYYLLANPGSTFLDYDGGYSPSSPWSQHWFAAMDSNIGQPLGDWSLFASGADPANPSLTYNIYQRSYSNGLVLYKPLSYGNNVSGTTADNTATTQALNGIYYPLQANGTLGAPITSITLRNGEGAILINATAAAAYFGVSGSPSSTTTATTIGQLDAAAPPAVNALTPFQIAVSAFNLLGNLSANYMGIVQLFGSSLLTSPSLPYAFTSANAVNFQSALAGSIAGQAGMGNGTGSTDWMFGFWELVSEVIAQVETVREGVISSLPNGGGSANANLAERV